MDVRAVASRLHIREPKVLHKALEYQRLLQTKQGGGVHLTTAHTVCCVDLACTLYHQHVNSAELLRYSGQSKPAHYANTLLATQAMLNLAPRTSIAQLAIQHASSPAHTSLASSLLSAFHSRLLASLPPAQRSQVDSAKSSYVLVAFYLATRKSREVIDKDRLMKDGGVSIKEWRGVELSMLNLCADVLRTNKRKRAAAAAEEQSLEDSIRGEELDAEHVAHIPALAGTTTAEYAAWKQRVIAQEQEAHAVVFSRVASANYDDEAEYGEDEDAAQIKRRRTLTQSQLPFAPARPGRSQQQRGAYSEAIVL